MLEKKNYLTHRIAEFTLACIEDNLVNIVDIFPHEGWNWAAAGENSRHLSINEFKKFKNTLY